MRYFITRAYAHGSEDQTPTALSLAEIALILDKLVIDLGNST